jgi:uncharacterized membrane protein required for colicin V production
VVLDLLLIAPLILYTLLGLRDGLVRKLVSIGAIVVALFLAQAFMHDAGEWMVDNIGTSPSNAPTLGFLSIFCCITLFVSTIYRLTSGNYKIGGVPDKVLGAILGFVQGALLASSLLLILAFQGFPSRATIRDSRLYKPIVNIAPQILDLGAEIGPGAMKNIENLTKPGGNK